MINHILLEAFCLKDTNQYASEPFPPFCPNAGKYADFQCLFRQCPFVAFTSCEDTLCYIGGDSDEVFGISYGGDMEEGDPGVGVEEWKEIAISKVKEAYTQFMEKKRSRPVDNKIR